MGIDPSMSPNAASPTPLPRNPASRRGETPATLPGVVLAFAVAVLLAAGAAQADEQLRHRCYGQAGPQSLVPAPATPAAKPARPTGNLQTAVVAPGASMARTAQASVGIDVIPLHARYSSAPLKVPPASIDGPDVNLDGPSTHRGIILPFGRGPGRAFADEMRDEALSSRRAGLYANIPEDFPQLLDDDHIRRMRAGVAENVIGGAFETAVGVAFFGKVQHQHSVTLRPTVATVAHGIEIAASPSWTWRRIAPRSGLRVDVPMTPNAIRLNAWKELKGTDRSACRLGAGVSVDPFDDSVRAGMTLEF